MFFFFFFLACAQLRLAHRSASNGRGYGYAIVIHQIASKNTSLMSCDFVHWFFVSFESNGICNEWS